MSESDASVRTVRCSCGNTEVEVAGDPITSVVCYCDDCREGSQEIEALPDAPPVQTPDGGTEYVLYREDRFRRSKGESSLRSHKLRDDSVTNRVVARCCNSAMFMEFDDSRHWVPVYRARFGDDAPPLEMRIQTKHRVSRAEIPTDAPAYQTFPLGFMWKLVKAAVSMRFGR